VEWHRQSVIKSFSFRLSISSTGRIPFLNEERSLALAGRG
jgi:hypothetical protein